MPQPVPFTITARDSASAVFDRIAPRRPSTARRADRLALAAFLACGAVLAGAILVARWLDGNLHT